MLFGIFVVAFTGNWVIGNYDKVSNYPKEAYMAFAFGWGSIICAYIMNKLSTYNLDEEKKDNRNLINKWERQGIPFNKWIIGIVIVVLVGAGFHSWSLVFKLFWLFLFIGIVFIGFLYVMMGERVEEPDGLDFTGKSKKFLDFVDYRRHPFTISLLLFSLVIVSFLLSKQQDIPMNLEVSGNPRYVTSLPTIAFLTSGLMVVSSYIYIINNGDIFGIRKAEQNGLKVLQIHFLEIIICGATLFIWLVEGTCATSFGAPNLSSGILCFLSKSLNSLNGPLIPALLKKTSIFPNSSTVCFI